uniref:hypothetical protein n=1 Tax=Burkholderia stagnalis TaxID=1503054 RepID=UPI001ABA32A6
MTLISLGFADCESCKALIFKGSRCAGKAPKAGVAGSIPAGRAKPDKASSGFVTSSYSPVTVKLQLAGCG